MKSELPAPVRLLFPLLIQRPWNKYKRRHPAQRHPDAAIRGGAGRAGSRSPTTGSEAVGDGPLPHDERRLTAVLRRLEDVVDREQPARQHEPRPRLVVRHGDVERVARRR